MIVLEAEDIYYLYLKLPPQVVDPKRFDRSGVIKFLFIFFARPKKTNQKKGRPGHWVRLRRTSLRFSKGRGARKLAPLGGPKPGHTFSHFFPSFL